MDDSLKPIIKWVGGKRRIMDSLLALMPPKDEYSTYIEPFLGGASVLLALHPHDAIINDINSELMNMYQQVKDNPENVINAIKSWPRDKKTFLEVRGLDRTDDYENSICGAIRAARFIYLNKTCFNGLYRVNSQGYFNVSFAETQKTMPDYDNMMKVSAYLNASNVRMMNMDYRDVLAEADDDSFIYLDPPYDEAFDKYDSAGFNQQSQHDLKERLKSLPPSVKWMQSNADTACIRSLYKEYNLHEVSALRSINPDANRRGEVKELVITNY